MSKQPQITVIGLGYVGLPLAVALARHFPVIGFDIDESRVQELHEGHDRTNEITSFALQNSSLRITHNPADIKNQDIYIVTVPTPVTKNNLPDLKPLENASKIVGKALSSGAIVVYESTVYPGITEEICGPILEKFSGLECGKDFYLGYSPERINPGDREHTLERITKVIAGQTPQVTQQLETIYGAINNNNLFVAKDIKTAEAAKVIENAQRDINIAFINEIALIFSKMGISVHDVLAAASSKWNFLKFQPGLVGGHCIGVDPYYLAYAARQLGHEPDVILAGRRINESMSELLTSAIHQALQPIKKKGKILVLGLTFKENVPDLRNTKVIDIIQGLKKFGHKVDVHDSLADAKTAKKYFKVDLCPSLDSLSGYDCVIGAVPHREYLEFTRTTFEGMLHPQGLVADIKNMWRDVELPKGMTYWSL